ncbi:MAG TPA: hypothetical protein DCZ93_05220 [Elusimicrobia bacterium]|nr:MAG: hypothetical protein A2X35_07340 [Elusimicrobia bacterium GWA2_61_42]OGR75026.1 MAG: hypothetical protein A2X38_01490 [Elusimicrobia bacterium GWC2_61_25]HBB66693.1 hypothetical protein [Elusimicrobiota bacterium]
MENMVNLYQILQCPACLAGLTESLKCTGCGKQFAREKDVNIMTDPRLSGKEWKWDESLFSEEKMKAMMERYKSYFNEETVKAQALWWAAMENEINGFSGLVGDLASGLGGMFGRLMRSGSDFTPVATDVDPNVLSWTSQKMKAGQKKKFFAVATDGKHLAFKTGTFNVVTSYAGLGNIPDTKLILAEIYRVLRKGGRLVVMQTFVDVDSSSHKLARGMNVERALIKPFLLADLAEAGFKNIGVDVASSAIWAENPMDGLPAAGDMQYFAIVKAEK